MWPVFDDEFHDVAEVEGGAQVAAVDVGVTVASYHMIS